MQTAQQMEAHAGYQSKGLPLRRRFESFSIFLLQDCIATAAEHAVRFAAAGVPVGKARAVNALQQKTVRESNSKAKTQGKRVKVRNGVMSTNHDRRLIATQWRPTHFLGVLRVFRHLYPPLEA